MGPPTTLARRSALAIAAALLSGCYPRTNPYDPECDPSQAACGADAATESSVEDAADRDAAEASTTSAQISVGNVSQHYNGGTSYEVYVLARNSGTAAATVVASLENVPTSVVINTCTEGPGGCDVQATCAAPCDCGAVPQTALQTVAPGQDSACPVLYINLNATPDAGASSIDIPVKFTSTQGDVWHDHFTLNLN